MYHEWNIYGFLLQVSSAIDSLSDSSALKDDPPHKGEKPHD